MLGMVLAASALAESGQLSGDFELPVTRVWRIEPDRREQTRALPKMEMEYAVASMGYRTTLKAEHEADVELSGGFPNHESKLEIELRRTAASSLAWEPYVRTAALSSGGFRESFSEPGNVEAAVGVKRRLTFRHSSGSVEIRLARRHGLRSDGDAWRPGVKLKWRSPVGRGWDVSSEANVTSVDGPGASRRISSKVRVFLLRPVGSKGPVRFGAMVFVDSSRRAQLSTPRIGIGPASTAAW